MQELSKQDQDFVKGVAITGNQTQSAKDAYGIKDDKYASVKGTRLIVKDSIKTALEEVKRSLADRIPDELLEKTHLEGLEATDDGFIDYAVRHKYLDSAYKLKGSYAPDKSINVNLEGEITNPKAKELAEKYEEELKKGL